MRVRIYETKVINGDVEQYEAGQIWLVDGQFSVHPATKDDAKFCTVIASEPVTITEGGRRVRREPKDGVLFMEALAHAYDGAYLRVSLPEGD